MIDSKIITSLSEADKTEYYFCYSFRNMPFLKADKYGNMFLLPHCPNNRTVNFKQLDTSRGYIYYKGNMVRLSTLRQRAIKDNNSFIC